MVKSKERSITVDGIARGWRYKSDRGEGIKVDKIIVRSNLSMKGVTKTKERLMILDYRMTRMWGQKGTIVKANRSVAEFNIREGGDLGEKISIRESRFIDAIYKMLVLVAKPRVNTALKYGISQINDHPQNSNSSAPRNHRIRNLTHRIRIIEGLAESYVPIIDWTFASLLESKVMKAKKESETNIKKSDIDKKMISWSEDINSISDKVREIKLNKEGLSWEISICAAIDSRGLKNRIEKCGSKIVPRQLCNRAIRTFIREYLKI